MLCTPAAVDDSVSWSSRTSSPVVVAVVVESLGSGCFCERRRPIERERDLSPERLERGDS
jgi:hypothetical protein